MEMCLGAIGTQTGGSITRPASYCGVLGYKPSHGQISRHGVLKQSPSLDHVGIIARTVEDVALTAGTLIIGDDKDPDVRPGVGLDLGPDWTTRPLGRPRLAFVRSPVWEHTAAITRDAFAGLNERWSDLVQEVELPPAFERAHEWHKILMESDLANSLGALYDSGKDRGLHPYEGETTPKYSGPPTPWKFLQEEKKYSWMKAPRYEGEWTDAGTVASLLRAAELAAGAGKEMKKLGLF